jgi:hypothetical protein
VINRIGGCGETTNLEAITSEREFGMPAGKELLPRDIPHIGTTTENSSRLGTN